jgi:uncharacterized membrane protein
MKHSILTLASLGLVFIADRTSEEAPMKKTATFAAVHMAVVFAVAYVMTGSIWVGSVLALVEPALTTVAYFFHEKVWERAAPRPAEIPA